MLSTENVRLAYPEPVIGRRLGLPVCDHRLVEDGGPAVLVDFPCSLTSDGTYPLKVHHKQREAWEAFARVMARHGYTIDDLKRSGTANCRNLWGRRYSETSLHAHLSALDLNPLRNTGTASDQPPGMVSDLEAIRTRDGSRVFRNLPNDRMHWQMAARPVSLAGGLDPATVPDPDTLSDVTWRRGDKGPTVRVIQDALRAAGHDPGSSDGIFGRRTEAATSEFQDENALSVTGVVESVTAAILIAPTVPGPRGPAGPTGPPGPAGPPGPSPTSAEFTY